MMRILSQMLDDSDVPVLPIIAEFWGIPVTDMESDEMTKTLGENMLDAKRAESVWNALNDEQRGALQMLISVGGGSMSVSQFGRLFGDIRQMGGAKIEREKPHENPESLAEALYYRGLIGQTFEQAETGPRAIVYVPDDLAHVLPTHQTSYADLDDAPGEAVVTLAIIENVEGIAQADTSIVDDLTTLLAYLQLYAPPLSNGVLAPEMLAIIQPYMLNPNEIRLGFMFGLALGAGLLDTQDGKARPKRAEARRWLSATRAVQVRGLAEAWLSSVFYRDLWHVPGLNPEPGGELDDYDPSVAREAAMELMTGIVPEQGWWSIDDFIEGVRTTDPDFQRPGGDYDSWYIRNDAGDYLHGFESWSAVEGALLEYYLVGPMHWLGLVDLAQDAARLTAYGRAFLTDGNWPTPPDPEDTIMLDENGTMHVSRKISRIDRFQMARFTSWGVAGDPYLYQLTPEGIERAGEQAITIEHIAAFINRVAGDKPLPQYVAQLLQTWQGGATAEVTFEHLLVLRTTAPETMDFIMDTPALRRYMGARLGPMAAVIRAGEEDALRAALGENGMSVEMIG